VDVFALPTQPLPASQSKQAVCQEQQGACGVPTGRGAPSTVTARVLWLLRTRVAMPCTCTPAPVPVSSTSRDTLGSVAMLPRDSAMLLPE
jgi:hypothetical protein